MTLRASLRWLVPFLLFAVLAGFLLVGLSLRPRELPSALIDRPVPAFAAEPLLPGGEPVSDASLKQNAPLLVNVFASWCAPCRSEHAVLMGLAGQGVEIVGLNYKDRVSSARAYLLQAGNPYKMAGIDPSGRISIDWGVYGVPETFVIDGSGRIVYKHVGPMTMETYNSDIAPLLAEGSGP